MPFALVCFFFWSCWCGMLMALASIQGKVSSSVSRMAPASPASALSEPAGQLDRMRLLCKDRTAIRPFRGRREQAMKICRFDNDRLGVVIGGMVHDVTA